MTRTEAAGIAGRTRWGRVPPRPWCLRSWLASEYLERGRSAAEIARASGCHENNILSWLKKHGIPRRSMAEARVVKTWTTPRGDKNPMFGRRGDLSPTWRGGLTATSALRWRANNPDKQRAACREWAQRNPLKVLAKTELRRARKRGARVERINYERIKARDRMVCHLCRLVVEPSDLHFDHVIPLARGGDHTEANLAVSHRWCNLKKGSKVLEARLAT